MKESTLATKVMIGILCVGVLLYLALYFLLGFRNEVATTVAYDYTVDVGTDATAIIVREETALPNSGTYVDQVLTEGEKTAAKATVALIYDHPSALNTRQAIRTLEAEIAQLEYALSSGTQAVDSSKLDEQVVGSIVALRSLAAGGDLSTLEDSVLNLRTMVFQRDYTFGDTGAAEQLGVIIAEKKAELDTLERSLSRVSQIVRAPASGIFSGEVDGYETLITPAMLDSLTLSGLEDLLDTTPPANPDGVGKVITDSTWYVCALFDGINQISLVEGKTYTLSFSHDYYGKIPMRLERLETSDGKTMAIFSSREKLSETTLIRIQEVDIVVEALTGIRVPRKTLRVETKSVTDDNGVTTEVNSYGVYTVVGAQAEWKEVKVLYTGDTYYLVEPINPASSSRLRSGDTIILSSTGLYDGKVVR